MKAEGDRLDRERGAAAAGAELARGSLINIVETLAGNLRGIFTFLIARLLGGATLGIFSTAWNLTDIVSQGAKFGLDQGMTTLVATREALGDPGGSRRLLRRGLSWCLTISIATTLAAITALRLWGASAGYHPDVITMATVLLCAIPGITLYYVANGFSRGKKVMQHSILSKGVVENGVTIAVFVTLVVVGFGRHLAPGIAVLAGTACGGIVAVRLAVGLARRPPEEKPSTAHPPLLRFSAPIAGFHLLHVLAQNMDIVLLATYVGKVEGIDLASLGVYAASIEIARGSRKLRQFIEPIFTPVVAAQVSTDYHLVEDSWNQSARWMVALILALLGILAFGGGLALAVFGPTFRSGLVWMWILGVTYGVLSLTGLNDLLLMVQRPTINLLNSSLAVLLQGGLMLWAIPRYGFLGAALSMLASAVVLSIVTLVELRLLYRLHARWASVRRPIKAFSLALLPALLLRWVLVDRLTALWPTELASTVVFLLAYFATWRWLGLDEADAHVVAQMRGQLRKGKPDTDDESLVDS